MTGVFEQAHGGTLFLDEIGDSLLSFQIKLLRVLQEKQVRRIGDDKLIPVDVRVIVATNKDIAQLVRERSFREDLYYRLNVLPLHLLPLRLLLLHPHPLLLPRPPLLQPVRSSRPRCPATF